CMAACAAAKPAALAPAASPSAAIASTTTEPAWLSALDRDHALVGRVWDVKANAFVGPGLLLPRLAAPSFVLLGERHDNPDHHRLQGRVVAAMVQAGRRPALVLEMLELAQQPAIDAYT